MSDKQTMDCCHRNGCKNWDISSYGNCQLSDRDFKKCGQINHYEPKTMSSKWQSISTGENSSINFVITSVITIR